MGPEEEAQKNGGPAAGGLLHGKAPTHRSVLTEDFLAI